MPMPLSIFAIARPACDAFVRHIVRFASPIRSCPYCLRLDFTLFGKHFFAGPDLNLSQQTGSILKCSCSPVTTSFHSGTHNRL